MAVDVISNVSWLQSLSRFGVKPGLLRTQTVLERLGNPERTLNFYHVAGTNGKGSVCQYLAALLSVHVKVGVFTSPAFDGYRGRFVVGEETIDPSEFESLIGEVRTVCETLTSEDALTEFEVLTVMAILYFSRKGVEAVVWETGLGGRYDSTNVVTPVMTAITNVSLDHTEILGDTVAKIAADKAGIIKTGIPIITGATGTALTVIERQAKEVSAPLYRKDLNFCATREQMLQNGQRLMYRGIYRDWSGLVSPLHGRYQVENFAIAFAMYELAVATGHVKAFASPTELRLALAKVTWPGRFQVIERDGKRIVLDGAHNVEGARRFAEALVEYSEMMNICPDGWVMVIGILADKDVSAMLDALIPLAEVAIVTQPSNSRAASANDIAAFIQKKRNDIEISIVSDVEDAMHAALNNEKGSICCWGSLYTVDEARKAMQR